VGDGIGGAKAIAVRAMAPTRAIEYIILKDFQRKKIEDNEKQTPHDENERMRKKSEIRRTASPHYYGPG
jgi:hypothetical protein